MTAEYPWLENVCYEPAPIKRTRYSAFAGRVFLFLCAMAVVVGVLAAVN